MFVFVLVRGFLALVSSNSSKQVGWGVDGGVKYWKVLSHLGAWGFRGQGFRGLGIMDESEVMFKPILAKSSCRDCLVSTRA